MLAFLPHCIQVTRLLVLPIVLTMLGIGYVQAQPRVVIQTAAPQPTSTGGGLMRPELQKVVGVVQTQVEDRRPRGHIVLSGLSKHFSASAAAEKAGLNERNWGIGYQLDIPRSKDRRAFEWNLALGAYKDSTKNVAVYAGGGGQYPIWMGEKWFVKAGVNLNAFYSQGYNNGKPFIATIPVLNIGTDAYSLNVVVIPKIPQFLDAGVVFTQLKIQLP